MQLVTLLTVLSVVGATNVRDRSFYEEKFFNWLAKFDVKAPSKAKNVFTTRFIIIYFSVVVCLSILLYNYSL